MKLELEFGSALCYCPVFRINDIDADKCDFGDQNDMDPENAVEYGCGDMQFTPKLASQDVLDKYGIGVAEYNLIAGQLAEGLSFGSCGWCV